MPKYRVRVMQTILEDTWVTVEAENAEHALLLAPEIAIDNEHAKWEFVEAIGDIEGTIATEIPCEC